jgi:hypothetical protein
VKASGLPENIGALHCSRDQTEAKGEEFDMAPHILRVTVTCPLSHHTSTVPTAAVGALMMLSRPLHTMES